MLVCSAHRHAATAAGISFVWRWWMSAYAKYARALAAPSHSTSGESARCFRARGRGVRGKDVRDSGLGIRVLDFGIRDSECRF